MFKFKELIFFISFGLLLVHFCDGYKIGVGRHDCTGPSVEVTFMGYAALDQRGEGLHLRQFARAFIVDDGEKRVVFVSVDAAMMGHAVKRDVISRLKEKYGDLYSIDNVVISGTHSHSAPGGFLMYLMYDIPSLGFVRETFESLVSGIFGAIVRAHDNIIEGRLFISEIDVLDASMNRSPSAYLNNPEEERAQYEYDTDKTLTQIQFVSNDNEIIGACNWFAVHPVSMNNTNRLVSTDNLGFASILLETEKNSNSMPGKGKFVAAFASSNLGDVTPNIDGPKCERTGEYCDMLTSSCPSGHGACFASGPGKDMFESTKIIAERVYNGASRLLKGVGREITGPVNFIHQFVEMQHAEAQYLNPKTKTYEKVRGCSAAMGYSFAAGTTDGPGFFDFTQGTTSDNELWNIVRNFIAKPTQDDIECQAPKPILLATGRTSFPYQWVPNIVTSQIIQIGDVAIAAVPGEFTTMSGRRVRNGVKNAILQATGKDSQVILAGLSNIYSSYVATPEEYAIQRYEGASTVFGPHSLTIYVDQFQKLATAMVKDETLDPGPLPAYLDDKLISLTTGVVYDGSPIGRNFGSVKIQPSLKNKIGDNVHAKFVAGNPRNNLMHEKTYLTVEKLSTDGVWDIVATDASWETIFKWERVSTVLGFSDIDVYWTVPETTEIGTYRICHFGNHKVIFGDIHPYQGCTNMFQIE